jgi:hypothetical protein
MPAIINTRRKLSAAVQHAKNICHGHQDTPQCRIAWDNVQELEDKLNSQELEYKSNNGVDWTHDRKKRSDRKNLEYDL